MTMRKWLRGSLAVLGLLVILLSAAANAADEKQDGKQIMIVFTTDTNGEVNPCG
jgi:ABC-type proline/glycine betaine transport system substrate-binding protein